MSLPEYTRHKYANNTLVTVGCQIRFRPIVKITGEEPVKVQEALRSPKSGLRYPNFKTQLAQQTAIALPQQLLPMLQQQLPGFAFTVHEFSTEDGTSTIHFARDFVSVSTSKYSGWEDFEVEINKATSLLSENYQPDPFLRIGLRFQNAIIPSNFGFEGQPWSAMISGHLLGEMADHFETAEFEMCRKQLLLDLKDGTKLLLQHGLGTATKPGDPPPQLPMKPNCYIIDIDCYTERVTEIKDAITTFQHLNDVSYRFYRWCITDELHNRMGPDSKPDDVHAAEQHNCA